MFCVTSKAIIMTSPKKEGWASSVHPMMSKAIIMISPEKKKRKQQEQKKKQK